MAKDISIAVYTDEEGNTLSLYQAGKISIYQREEGEWKAVRSEAFSLSRSSGLMEMRLQLARAIGFMTGCRAFVGKSVVGLPFFELEKAGFSIWEFSGRPEEYLEYILDQEEAADAKRETVKEMPVPVPADLGNGHFRISIKEVQESSGGMTSKQVLQPFLRRGKFYSLEVICSHVPPWLEAEALASRLSCVADKRSNRETRLVITRNCCGT